MAAIHIVLSRAALFAVALAVVEPSELHAQASPAPAEASRHFERGYLLAQQGSLEGAINEFQQAYALQPHPSVLYNLGQAYAASGRAVEAVDTLQRFLAESPASDVQRRAQASALMEYQAQRIGFLTVVVSPPEAQLSLDGVVLARSSEPVRLTAGWHAVTAALDGYEPNVSGAQITGKETTSLALVLRKKTMPPAQPSVNLPPDNALGRLREERQHRANIQRTSAILAGGAGVASLVAAGILFASNQNAYADWRRESLSFADGLDTSRGATRSDLDRLLARENTLRNRDAWALGLAVFGGVMTASSAVLWLSLPRAEPSGVSLRLGPEPWLGYAGSF